MGIKGWQARKKSYNRTTWRKSDRTWPNHVMSQLRAKTVPTSALKSHRSELLHSFQTNAKKHSPNSPVMLCKARVTLTLYMALLLLSLQLQ